MQYILSLIFFSFISISIGAESSNIKDSSDINTLVKDQQTEDSNYCEIITSCLQGNSSLFLTEFKKNKAVIKDICNLDNEPLIISAVKGGNYEIVKILLDNGVDIYSLNKDTNTPLHLAAFYGHYKIVELLLEYGADIHKKGYIGYTPLCHAAQKGHDETIQLLVNRGANLEHQDNYSRTPLLLASFFSKKESTLTKLYELGAKPNNISTFDTFLMPKNIRKHLNMLKQQTKTIEKKQSKNIKKNHLHIAVKKNYDEVIPLEIICKHSKYKY